MQISEKDREKLRQLDTATAADELGCISPAEYHNDFVTANPSIGVVLQANDATIRLSVGDTVKNLAYVDHITKELHTITGVLRRVSLRDVPQCSVRPSPCMKPKYPPKMFVVGAIEIDASTEYHADIHHIHIQDIRGFTPPQISPDKEKVFDVNFITDTDVSFCCGFNPVLVLWNGKNVTDTLTKRRSPSDDVFVYGIVVDTVLQHNVLIAVTEDGVSVSSPVIGLRPELAESFTLNALNDKIKAISDKYYNTAENSSIEIDHDDVYIDLYEHCYSNEIYGGDTCRVSLGKNSFAVTCAYRWQPAGTLQIFAPYVMQLLLRGVKTIDVLGFTLSLPEILPNDILAKKLSLSNVLRYGETEDKGDVVTWLGETIELHRHDKTTGVSFILKDVDGVKLPAGTVMCSAIMASEEHPNDTPVIAQSAISVVEVSDAMTDSIYVNYSSDAITVPTTVKRTMFMYAADYGCIEITVIVHDVIE